MPLPKRETSSLPAVTRLRYSYQLKGLNTSIPTGWIYLITKILSTIDLQIKHEERRDFKISDICEQYGRLKIRTISKNTSVLQLIAFYSAQSLDVCMHCGSADAEQMQDTLNGQHMKTLCFSCCLEVCDDEN